MAESDNLVKSASSKLGGYVDMGVGAAASSLINNMMIGKQVNAAKELMDYQNEYNKPINQVSRLKEAGFNPAMMFGNGSSMPAAASPTLPHTDAALAAQMAQVSKQNQLLDKQIKMADEDIESKKLDNINKGFENQAKEYETKERIYAAGNRTYEEEVKDLLYIYYDEEKGENVYGYYDYNNNFIPVFDKDGNYFGLSPLLKYNVWQEQISKGIKFKTDLYEMFRGRVESAIAEKYGEKTAKATINQLDAMANQANESGRAMKLDNDVFENIEFGGKSVGLAVDVLKVLLSTLRK